MPEWENSDLMQIGKNKREFLEDRRIFRSILEQSHPSCYGLMNTWVRNLRVYFKDLTFGMPHLASIREKLEDAIEARNDAEVAKLESQLNNLMEERNRLIDYRNFMQCIGLDE